MKKGGLFTIFLIVAIGLLGFGLILPLLPFYAETFGATPGQVGLLVASYAAAQFIGAPILGRASDRFGRRPVLIISILGTITSFVILALANSLWMLFASRLLDGFTGGNISIAQAYITDVTDEKSRSKGLGLIGAAFGLGFIFGPAIGGALSVYGYALPAWVAAGFSILSLLGVLFWLPESLTPEMRVQLAAKARQEFTLQNLLAALRRPKVGPLLHIRFFYGLAFAAFQSIFPLFAQYQLGFNAQQTGYVLAYVGVLVVLVQGVGVGWFTARLSENRLVFWSAGVLGVTLLAWGLSKNLVLLLVVLAPLALASGLLNTLLNSLLTKSVDREEFGGILGLSASIESLTRVIAPSVAGYLLGSLGAWAPGAVSALIMAWTAVYIRRHIGIRSGESYTAEIFPEDNLTL
jgi:DHA1 family tetracycline resistance protein-like MFS transporter